jgi:hypothetical protein
MESEDGAQVLGVIDWDAAGPSSVSSSVKRSPVASLGDDWVRQGEVF